MAKEKLILFISYSRSGGTLLSRCLEAMGEVFVLSEVHRLNYKLSTSQYIDQISELSNLLRSQGKTLLVRDWSFIDFTPHRINGYKPTNALTQYDLLKTHFDIQCVTMIRNPIDIWISRKCPPKFFEIYPLYTQALKHIGIPYFKYESLCQDPKQVVREICNTLNLTYEGDFLNNYKSVNIQGDAGLEDSSRGSLLSTVQPLKRKRIATKLQKMLEKRRDAGRLDFDFGYNAVYNDAVLEKTPSYISLDFKHYFDCIRGRYPRDTY